MRLTSFILLLFLTAPCFSQIIEQRDFKNPHPSESDFRKVNFMQLAALVHIENLKKIPLTKKFKLIGPTAAMRYNLCSDQDYATQISVAKCAGIMVSKEVILTSASCFESIDDCENYRWVFDYNYNQKIGGVIKVTSDNIFSCRTILRREYDKDSGVDYMAIALKREPPRGYMDFRVSGQLSHRDKLLVPSFHMGTPMKVTKGLLVNSLRKDEFSFCHPSIHPLPGSPVYNWYTGQVEGLVTSFNKEFLIYDHENQCNRIVSQGNEQCNALHAMKIHRVFEL